MVRVAVALPLLLNTTEFEVNEHVGAPACAGWTEQSSETGLSNAFNRLSEMVDVELCPGVIVLGVSAVAEIEKSVPAEFMSTLIMFPGAFWSATKSGDPLLSRSATAPM